MKLTYEQQCGSSFADWIDMATEGVIRLIFVCLAVFSASVVVADDPYRFYTWTVTYGTVAPLGVPQQVGGGDVSASLI